MATAIFTPARARTPGRRVVLPRSSTLLLPVVISQLAWIVREALGHASELPAADEKDGE